MRGHVLNSAEELEQAELHVARARAAVAEEQRQADKAALRVAKAEGRAMKAEYVRLEREFRQAEQQGIEKQIALSAVNQQLSAHIAAAVPDDPLDGFTEEEEAAWVARSEELKQMHRTLVEELRQNAELREPLKMEAVRLATRMDQQRFVVRNLVAKLEDPNGDRVIRRIGGLTEV